MSPPIVLPADSSTLREGLTEPDTVESEARLRRRLAEVERQVRALQAEARDLRARLPAPEAEHAGPCGLLREARGEHVPGLAGARRAWRRVPFTAEGSPEYREARDAYCRIAYGTTDAKRIRRLQEDMVRTVALVKGSP